VGQRWDLGRVRTDCFISCLKQHELELELTAFSFRKEFALLFAMGGCCSRKGEEADEVVVELNDTVVNACVQCRAGKHGEGVTVKTTDKGNYHVGAAAGGTLLGSCSLDCDVAYWEVKVVKGGPGVNIGLKKFVPKRPCALDGELVSGTNDGKGADPCWIIQKENLGKGKKEFQDGDVIGVHWDQTDFPMVSFTLNGEFLPSASITRIRPAQDIYPAVSVANGSEVEICFDGSLFAHKPAAAKFLQIICASSLI